MKFNYNFTNLIILEDPFNFNLTCKEFNLPTDKVQIYDTKMNLKDYENQLFVVGNYYNPSKRQLTKLKEGNCQRITTAELFRFVGPIIRNEIEIITK
jgi:hypothetical protein